MERPPQTREPLPADAVAIGDDLVLDGRLALYHRAEKWLAVADLHYGYEVTKRLQGGLFPLWGMQTISDRMLQLVSAYQPETVVLCGDIVDGEGAADEATQLVEMLGAHIPGPVVCIAGNHDRGTVRRRLDFVDEWETESFRFHHGDDEAKAGARGSGEEKAQLTGHLHPTANLHDGAGLSLTLPALVQTISPGGGPLWVLPAFSPWASGRDWRRYRFPSPTKVWACSPKRVFRANPER